MPNSTAARAAAPLGSTTIRTFSSRNFIVARISASLTSRIFSAEAGGGDIIGNVSLPGDENAQTVGYGIGR